MLMLGGRELDIDVVIIDEAQDLSTAQWRFIEQTFRKAKRMYIGGDDDQAIFEWSGADVNYFINLKGEKTVLSQSYRIPKSIHDLSQTITDKIKHRTHKPYHSKKEQGEVDYWMSLDDIDMSSGSWLLLARNSYLLGELAASTKAKGFNYMIKGKPSISTSDINAIKLWEKCRKGYKPIAQDLEKLAEYTTLTKYDTIWHDAFNKIDVERIEYFKSLNRRGESLLKPRINISTIHGSKGGEADHVALTTDMAYSTWDATNLNMDAEHRVWFVGATRAKQSLHIVQPRGRYYYDI